MLRRVTMHRESNNYGRWGELWNKSLLRDYLTERRSLLPPAAGLEASTVSPVLTCPTSSEMFTIARSAMLRVRASMTAVVEWPVTLTLYVPGLLRDHVLARVGLVASGGSCSSESGTNFGVGNDCAGFILHYTCDRGSVYTKPVPHKTAART